jgi:hypothetical protein
MAMETMNNGTNERNSPEYIARILDQKSQSDPKELAIREKIAAQVLQEDWVRSSFSEIRLRQIDYLKDMVAHAGNIEYVHATTQEFLKEIAERTRANIVEGIELLAAIPQGSPVLIATNHFGAYKLCGVSPKDDIGVAIPGYESMYPYPMYFAPLSPVAEALGDNLYYASNDFPGVFGQIHSDAGFIHVPALAESKTAALVDQAGAAIAKHRNAAIVNYPEGTTSGKPTGLGPYDLNPFKTGAYVIASQLNIHIVPVAQYFSPHKGFELKVFEPFIPGKTDRSGYEAYAQKNHTEMQVWLDSRKNTIE